MKVAFVFSGLPHYLVKLLNKINEDAQIDVCVIKPKFKSATLGSGVHVLENGNNFKIFNLKEYKTWFGKPFFKGFYQVIKTEKINIIVIGWPYFIFFIFNPLLVFKLKKNKVKIIAREIPFSVPYFNEDLLQFSNRCAESQKTEKIFHSKFYFNLIKFFRKFLYSKIADGALTYTEEGVDILSSYGMDMGKIITTYNSPDTDEILKTISQLNQSDIIKNKFRIIHVGRLVYWKRVDLLIDAVNILIQKYPNTELAIIGKGEEENKLKQKVNELELGSFVNFLGAIYEGKQQSIEMLKSGVYVLAGMGGLSINEAMCHSLPIVCSIADGTEKQLVKIGFNGYIFEDNNLESLVDAIEKIWENNPVALGLNSKKIIDEKYNIKTVSEIYIKALKNFFD